MGLLDKQDTLAPAAGGKVEVMTGAGSTQVVLTVDDGECTLALLTPDEARRLGRALLQHAARLTLAAGRNLTGDPGGSAVDTDGSTG